MVSCTGILVYIFTISNEANLKLLDMLMFFVLLINSKLFFILWLLFKIILFLIIFSNVLAVLYPGEVLKLTTGLIGMFCL